MTAQVQTAFTVRIVGDFDVLKISEASDFDSECLQSRFFGGKASGKPQGWSLEMIAVLNLVGAEDPMLRFPRGTLQFPLEPIGLDDIDP